ncbi:proline racemase family protein [Bacillus sp. 1P02SD]|uniref:proline racemase family protein n=1 Tax=Bacillus sp. 1P02SD TaxID=3132264 RepID=UPI00399FCC61
MEFTQHFTSIDVHTAGEPLRIITGGIPPIPGKTILEKRAYFLKNMNHIREVLMYEPRGHDGMYGCIITEPVSAGAHFGVLFMHNEGLSTMCGHGIIAAVTTVIETGLYNFQENEPIVIDSPAGTIIAYAQCDGTKVKSVSFENVPSFMYEANVPLQVSGKSFSVDIVFGGAFYAIVDARDIGLKVEITQLADLKKIGRAIKEQIESKVNVQHPFEQDINGIYGVIISDSPVKHDSHLRNVTVFAEEQIDRSPCGTGTSARVAALYHHGDLSVGEKFVHESIIDSQFIAEVVTTTKIGNYKAVVPKITGSAFITGFQQFVVDPSDPLKKGFLLR